MWGGVELPPDVVRSLWIVTVVGVLYLLRAAANGAW